MSTKYDLVIFDAVIIIYLIQIGKLDSLLKICTVYLTGAVYNEIIFYKDIETGDIINIDLNQYISDGQIKIRDLDMSIILQSDSGKRVDYFIRTHQEIQIGEKEAICFVLENPKYKFCTGDAGAYKLMGYLDIKENAISLEEILGKLKNMEKQYKSEFMKECLAQGSKLMIEDM